MERWCNGKDGTAVFIPKGLPTMAIKQTAELRAGTKQARVIGLLNRPAGATIPAIMKATGWQAHSIRAFLAVVVRKKLGLRLDSAKTNGKRVYRILARKPKRKAAA
jgi:hypothetical protein